MADYRLDFKAGLGFSGQLNTARSFYKRHPGWLVAQIGFFVAQLTLGVVGLLVPSRAAAIWLLVATVPLGVAAMRIPAARERVTEAAKG